ncbi:MAG: tRNA (guanosine(46)-N7)-methyltransferase TrmB [Alphaproteobacteria bacterium]
MIKLHSHPLNRVYGRRQSRPLRKNKKQLMATLLPQLCIDLDEPFVPPTKPLWLEIGFGGGEHMAAIAQANPDVCFIGCDPFINGVASLLKSIDTLALHNIRIAHHDARNVLLWIPDAALSRIYILFPDPWPKQRHNKRRLIKAETLTQLARVLQPGGQLVIATDHADYLKWIQEVFEQQSYFHADLQGRADIYERPQTWVASRYEEKALAAGRHPGYMVFFK